MCFSINPVAAAYLSIQGDMRSYGALCTFSFLVISLSISSLWYFSDKNVIVLTHLTYRMSSYINIIGKMFMRPPNLPCHESI